MMHFLIFLHLVLLPTDSIIATYLSLIPSVWHLVGKKCWKREEGRKDRRGKEGKEWKGTSKEGKKKLRSKTAKCMNLEDLTLSEISQVQKERCCMFSFP